MKRIPWLLMGWAGSLAAAPIVWWLVGDVSEPLGQTHDWTAPEWMVENAHLFGKYGIVAMISVAALEFVGVRLHVIARHTLAAFLPLIAAAAVMAFNYRVMTAHTNGQNVGGGVAMLLGIPVVVGLAVIHYSWLRADLRRTRYDFGR